MGENGQPSGTGQPSQTGSLKRGGGGQVTATAASGRASGYPALSSRQVCRQETDRNDPGPDPGPDPKTDSRPKRAASETRHPRARPKTGRHTGQRSILPHFAFCPPVPLSVPSLRMQPYGPSVAAKVVLSPFKALPSPGEDLAEAPPRPPVQSWPSLVSENQGFW